MIPGLHLPLQRPFTLFLIMSHLSNLYTSSLYEGDSRDTADSLSYLQSDNLHLLNTEPSFSQRTITSAPESDFVQPPIVPGSLQRVGPDRKKTWILYSEMSKDEFVEWWLRTTHGSEHGDKKKFNWNRSGHLSDVWNHFDQVAHHTTGLPKVMCRRCGKILDHPSYTAHGTNSMGRHWKGEKCRRSANQASKQPNIRSLMQDTVRILIRCKVLH